MRPTTTVLLGLFAGGCGASHAPSDPSPRDAAPDADAGCVDPEACPELCEKDPLAAGCPCDEPEPQFCYAGPEGTAGIGECRAGLRLCALGTWGPCDGQVLPTDEVCDEVDDDCDGQVDEGVTNECGNCSFDCQIACVGDGKRCVPWDVRTGGDDVVDCGDGPCVTLEGGPVPAVLWVASAAQGLVSKIDTREREEIGRYVTSADALVGSPAPIAVDLEGDAFVVNRAPGAQGSVTAIANACEDVDGDGVVDTSSGGDDVRPWGTDECVRWNVDVGCAAGGDAGGGLFCGIPRAVAVHDRLGLDAVRLPGLWVGIHHDQRFVELDRDDGDPTGEEAQCGCSPWDAQVDDDEVLWATCAFGPEVCRFDTQWTDDVETLVAPGEVWGVTVGSDGRVWTGGDGLVYDPILEAWEVIGAGATDVVTDGSSWAWFANLTSRVALDTLDRTFVDAPSYGIAIDVDGIVWGIPGGSGNLNVIDPGSLEVERIFDDCGGSDCLPHLETYGDPGGDQLRIAIGTGSGTYTTILEGCESGTNWMAFVYRADFPEGSRIAFRARGAYWREDLELAEWIAIASAPADESPVVLTDAYDYFGNMQFLEVEATLVASDEGPPVLWMFGGEYECFIGL